MNSLSSPVFIPFLNDKILDIYCVISRIGRHAFRDHAFRAIYEAYLLVDGFLIVPTVDLIQSPILSESVAEMEPLLSDNAIIFSGANEDPIKLIESKKKHFEKTRIHPSWFDSDAELKLNDFSTHFSRRSLSTTKDLYRRWTDSVAKLDSGVQKNFGGPEVFLNRAFIEISDDVKRRKFVSAVGAIPEKLDGQAFLWPVVIRQDLPKFLNHPDFRYNAELALASQWVLSHSEEYGASILAEIPRVGNLDCGLAVDKKHLILSAKTIRETLRMGALSELLEPLKFGEMVALRNSTIFRLYRQYILIPVFETLREGTPLPMHLAGLYRLAKKFANRENPAVDILNFCESALDAIASGQQSSRDLPFLDSKQLNFKNQSSKIDMSTSATASRVFIGHGRSKAWRDLKDLLQDRLHVPWDEFNRVSTPGMTQIQRLEQMLGDAAVAFIILTGEDESADGTIRARENAVHELGLFQGRLGFDKAIVLLENGCNEFSNIHGLTQIRFPKDNILAVSEDIRLFLEKSGLIA